MRKSSQSSCHIVRFIVKISEGSEKPKAGTWPFRGFKTGCTAFKLSQSNTNAVYLERLDATRFAHALGRRAW